MSLTRDPDLALLYRELQNPNALNRKRAIFALLKRGDQGCVDMLQELSIRDEDVEVRYYAAKAMNFLGGPPKRQKLGETGGDEVLSDARVKEALADHDPEVRLRCIQLISKNNAREYLPVLNEFANEEKDPMVRSALPLAFAMLGGNAAMEVVIQKFLQDANARVRANAIDALERIGDKRAYPFIIGYLQDKDNRVRTNAAMALGKFGKMNLIKTLEAMLARPQVWMRDSAAFALQVTKVPEAVPLLEKAIQDPYQGVRIKAKKALQLLAAKGIETAQQVLDKYPHVKEEESLEDFLKLAEAIDRPATMTAKTEADDPAAGLEPKEVYKFDHLERDKRIKEILKVGENQDLAMGRKLLDWLQTEKDAHLRATLISTLGRLQYQPALPILCEMVNDPENRVRANVVEALGLYKDDNAYRKLTSALRDKHHRVVANAILALDKYPHVDIYPVLEKLASHQKVEFKRSALHCIRKLKTYNAIKFLEKFLGDPDKNIRSDALMLLTQLKSEGNLAAASILKAAVRG